MLSDSIGKLLLNFDLAYSHDVLADSFNFPGTASLANPVNLKKDQIGTSFGFEYAISNEQSVSLGIQAQMLLDEDEGLLPEQSLINDGVFGSWLMRYSNSRRGVGNGDVASPGGAHDPSDAERRIRTEHDRVEEVIVDPSIHHVDSTEAPGGSDVQHVVLDNHVAAFDTEGKQVGIVFETATPFETPMLMDKLLAWHAKEEADPVLHPLLRIAVFNVVFLAIHPFQDGNGRLSRVLTNLMLLRAGYAYASYTSLESVIEHNKEAYYLALRRTQTSFQKETDWEPWVIFFLRALRSQIGRLRDRLATHSGLPEGDAIPDDLSPLAGRLLKLLAARQTLSVSDAAEALGANRHTLKDKFTELIENGYAELRGKGRGAHYRPVSK